MVDLNKLREAFDFNAITDLNYVTIKGTDFLKMVEEIEFYRYVPDHNIKLSSLYFDDVASGRKSFEIRYNDRPYTLGDKICFQEVDEIGSLYTGRKFIATITYLLNNARYCKEGYVTFSLDVNARNF